MTVRNAADPNEYIGLTEASQQFDISPQTLRRLCELRPARMST